MSSYGGQQNFPFGYDPNAIGGIGLPAFLTPPGHPTGQPLLTDVDNKNFHNFLTSFDQNNQQELYPLQHTDFQHDPNNDQTWNLPPTFVGSETSLGPRSAIDPHHLQMGGFMNGSVPGGEIGQMMTGPPFDHGMNAPSSVFSHPYPDHLLNQLQTAASSGPNAYGNVWQHQQQYPQNYVPIHGPGRPMPRFGSDSHFQPTGYSAPNGQVAPDVEQMQELTWLEAQSSATNTQPNTEPNTQPSSPNMSRKRTFGDYQEDILTHNMNGFANGHRSAHHQNPSPPTSGNRRHGKSIKHEQSSPSSDSSTETPLANGQARSPISEADADADADAESDNDAKPSIQERSFWPANKPRPSSKPPPKPKPAKSSRKSTSSATANQPIKPNTNPKPKTPRRSSANNSAAILSHTPRTVLTAAQKKANHTNSEQRRRDTTQRRNAELFDMVPELEPLGKSSTFKKMAVVVDKLERVKAGVATLRQQYEQLTGRPWMGMPQSN